MLFSVTLTTDSLGQAQTMPNFSRRRANKLHHLRRRVWIPVIDRISPFDLLPSMLSNADILFRRSLSLSLSSEQYDEMKSIVEAAFARMPGSVCKRDALLKWCGEKLAHYVRSVFFECSTSSRLIISIGYWNHELLQLLDGWYCLLLSSAFVHPGSYRSRFDQKGIKGKTEKTIDVLQCMISFSRKNVSKSLSTSRTVLVSSRSW